MNLLGQPIFLVRQQVGHHVYWTGKERGGPRDGWGLLKRAAGRNLWVDEQGFESILSVPTLASLHGVAPRMIHPTFIHLREGSLIGIIDSQDAVHSRFIVADRLAIAQDHSSFWPTQKNGRWRWRFDGGLTAFVPENAPDAAQWEAVRTHVTKHYGVRFWDNGYHDLHHFLAHLSEERARA